MRKKRMAIGYTSLTVLILLLAATAPAAEPANRITRLKDLHLDTVLVSRGQPAAVIVAPAGARYADAIETVQAAVRTCAGTTLPVRRDGARPEALLKTTHVVALGNMATNPFIEHMYRQWYVLLDVKYPGKGGYVVRSCHNPYGTGHNVIWLGGSDDAGVSRAAAVFAGLLTRSDPLKVGWLMQIQLGDGITAPTLRDGGEGWSPTVYGWRDSWRKIGNEEVGYGPAATFGWNEISVAGALYYMTGVPEHLAYFKKMAMPDPDNAPRANRKESVFKDPLDPLVKNSHYHTHLTSLVWDLIEESPLFTDRERLFLTNKFLDQQNHYDPKDTYRSWGRHGEWHMMCIYTGSRYFAKYYPAPRWERRMANVREAYRGSIGDELRGNDTLYWISTYMEPTFDFFMLDGFDEFVSSGAARKMMSGLEAIWTGESNETSTAYIPISLLHKAAHMLKDGRYIWFLRKLGFDFDVFRIGQSFWPAPDLTVEPPDDRVGRISVVPMPKSDWNAGGKAIGKDEGIRFLSYRGGLTGEDDWFMIDGFYGKGRHPYHVNTLHELRMCGRTLLRGFGNHLSVRRNGIVEEDSARTTALKKAVALNGVAYVKTHVPNMPFSAWDRHLLFVQGAYLFVCDELTARAPGTFDIRSGWSLLGTPAPALREKRRVSMKEGATLCCAQAVHVGATGRQAWSGELKQGATFALNTLIHTAGEARQDRLRIDPLGARANLVRGARTAFVGVGPYSSEALTVEAGIASVSSNSIFLADATRLACGGRTVFESEKPVCVRWQLDSGRLAVHAAEAGRITLATDGTDPLRVAAGEQALGAVPPAAGLPGTIAHALAGLENAIQAEDSREDERATAADWQPRWKAEIKGSVTDVAVALHSAPRRVWAVTEGRERDPKTRKEKDVGRLALLSTDGKVVGVREYGTPTLSLWAAADPTQAAAFSAVLVTGYGDETIRAYAADGRELWKHKTEVHESWRDGTRYKAPWFSDPGVVKRPGGLQAGDFWNTGKQVIAVGRPSTVAFRDLSGKLLDRWPVRYGRVGAFAPCTKRGEEGGKPRPAWLLAGYGAVSAFDRAYRKVNGSGWYCAAGAKMGAWLQRELSHLVVADLDNNGVEEVIVGLSGHWNEVDVYSSEVKGWHKWLWRRYFGPGWPMSRTLRAVLAVDVTGDGKKEVVAGLETGWLCVFDDRGEPVWQKKFPHAVLSVCATGEPGTLVVGCGGGMLYLLGPAGQTLRTARLNGAIEVVRSENHAVVAGTQEGEVAVFAVPGAER
ncbi:MAG: hypothetical protein JXR37_00340 [Kiritimatiellae bacterium]|nr:hypothetical protein [Kiritimatiellia bacterium]